MSDAYYIEGNVYMRINKKLQDHDNMVNEVKKLRNDIRKKFEECRLIAKQNGCEEWFADQVTRRYDIKI